MSEHFAFPNWNYGTIGAPGRGPTHYKEIEQNPPYEQMAENEISYWFDGPDMRNFLRRIEICDLKEFYQKYSEGNEKITQGCVSVINEMLKSLNDNNVRSVCDAILKHAWTYNDYYHLRNCIKSHLEEKAA